MRRRVWQARSLKTTGPMPRISKDAARAWSERMKRAPCSPSPAHCSRQALRSRRRLASGVGKTWLSSRCKARRQCRHRNHRRGHCDVGRCGGPVHVSAISRSAPPAASRRSLQSRLPARSVVRRSGHLGWWRTVRATAVYAMLAVRAQSIPPLPSPQLADGTATAVDVQASGYQR